MIGVGRRLNRVLEVWRPGTAPDSAGGHITTLVQAGTVRAKVDQPSASDQREAGQNSSQHTRAVYLLPGADVRRGDELRGGGQALTVHHVYGPSDANYRRADCQETQTEGSP